MTKKTVEPAIEAVDIEWVEGGDTLKIWDKRIEGWRYGRVESIGPVYFQVVIAHKVRKVRKVSTEADPIYLIREGKSLRLEGGVK